MCKRDLIFQGVVEHFLKKELLDDYCELLYSLTLYDEPNNPKNINDIKKYMASLTSNYKIIILPPFDGLSNIKILDIGI